MKLMIYLAAVLTLFSQSFDVASVKPAVAPAIEPMFCIVPCAPGERLTVTGSRVDIRFMSLQRLILTAYRLKPHQLSGPSWMSAERFDILAKLPDGGSKDAIPEMLQALLADRFKLTVHRENKEQPVFALVSGKTGAKLQEAAADADAPAAERPGSRALYTPQGEASELNGNLVVTGGPFGPIRAGRGSQEGFKMEFLKLTMPGLAELLTPQVDRPVIDMTGLKGSYYFSWAVRPPTGDGGEGRKGMVKGGGPPEGGRGGDGADAGLRQNPMAEAMFAAIAKAGLKLERHRAPVETTVVDHLEKAPTAN
jgi:uncharacterized protein (TIGR03435 family)